MSLSLVTNNLAVLERLGLGGVRLRALKPGLVWRSLRRTDDCNGISERLEVLMIRGIALCGHSYVVIDIL